MSDKERFLSADNNNIDNISLSDPSLYINRELSALAFQQKVLNTACDESLPILERLRYLAILHHNMDEFFMVRLTSLQESCRTGDRTTGPDNMRPISQLARIRRTIQKMHKTAENLWLKEIKPALKSSGPNISRYEKLSGKNRAYADKYFEKEIFPILTPQAIDAGHPFPMISGSSINLLVELRKVSSDGSVRHHLARIKCPDNTPRFIFIDEKAGPKTPVDRESREGTIILSEDLIASRLERLFPGCRITAKGLFRITRNCDLSIKDDNSTNILSAVQDFVVNRRFGDFVRLQFEYGMPVRLQQFLKDHLSIRASEIFRTKAPLGFSDFYQLCDLDYPDLKFPEFKHRLPEAFEPDADIFAEIEKKDQLLFHPYDSFDAVVNFLNKAANDPHVTAVKQTLYRCGKNSPVVAALMEAKKKGKNVTAIIELKARFNEEENISCASDLERAGVHVVYGFSEAKIHAKFALVVRQVKNKITRYVHISTGNYNAATAAVYSDLGLFTADPLICEDIHRLFNMMTGLPDRVPFTRIAVSPYIYEERFPELIENEIRHHKIDGKGHIILKCNRLVEPDCIRLLYKASQAGVKVECIVRGICCLRPGIPGVSDNITVRCLMGRLHEHARVYYFRQGGERVMYLGSADPMKSANNHKFEVLTPVLDPELRKVIRDKILKPQLQDNCYAWTLENDGSYSKVRRTKDEQKYNSYKEIAGYFSDRK